MVLVGIVWVRDIVPWGLWRRWNEGSTVARHDCGVAVSMVCWIQVWCVGIWVRY